MAATNRFSTSPNDQYISQYVPLPLEQMYKVGIGMKQEHATKQAEIDALADQLNKIKVTNSVISEGSGEDLGIKSRNIGYGDYKNEVLNKYTLANKQLADEYQSGKLDTNQFSQRVNKLKSDFGADYQKLKIAEANSAAIEEMDKKYRDNKDAGMNQHLLNQLAEEGSNLLKNPYGYSYKGAPIGEALDLGKKVNDYSNNYADQVLKSGSYKTKDGHIIRDTFTGVDRDRIIDGASRGFDMDAELKNDFIQQAKRNLLDRGISLNSKEGVDLFNKTMNEYKMNFVQTVVDKAEKELKHESVTKDWQAAKQWDWAHQEQVAKAQVELVGKALPGSELDIFVKDPQAKELLEKGIIKVNNGIASIDYSGGTPWQSVGGKLFYTKEEAIQYNKSIGAFSPEERVTKATGSNVGLSPEEHKKLDIFLEKAAKIAGIPTDKLAALRSGKLLNAKGEKISWNSMSSGILTAYNRLSKVRMGGVELPAAVQEIESKKVSASPSSYDTYDPITHAPIPNRINKGDKVLVGERVYVDGKGFDKTVIQRGNDKDGNPITETVLLKPKSLEKSDYFDRGVGSTQNAIVDLTVYGGEVPKEKLAKHIQGYNPNLTGKDKTAQDSNLFNVTTNFDHDNNSLTPSIPTKVSTFAKGVLSNNDGKQVSYQFVRNDDDLNQQTYLLFLPDRKEPLPFNDYSQFLTHADAAYYLYGQGKNDAAARLNKKVYEQMLSSTNQED